MAKRLGTAAFATVAALGAGELFALAERGGTRPARTLGIATAAALPLLAVTGLIALERQAAVFETARSWLMLRRARQHSRAWLKRARADLADLLDQVYDWLSAETPAPSAAQRPR
jgi:hypothetical protein